jgi:hypothetical protein
MCLHKLGKVSLNVCFQYRRLIKYFLYDEVISLNHWSSVHVSRIVQLIVFCKIN